MIGLHVLSAITGPFARLWRGQQPLPKAFWGFFVLGTILAPALAMVAAIPLILLDQPQAARPLFLIALVIYPAFAAVGVWRSANARPFRRWPIAAAAAKIWVCLSLLAIASRVSGITFLDLIKLLPSG